MWPRSRSSSAAETWILGATLLVAGGCHMGNADASPADVAIIVRLRDAERAHDAALDGPIDAGRTMEPDSGSRADGGSFADDGGSRRDGGSTGTSPCTAVQTSASPGTAVLYVRVRVQPGNTYVGPGSTRSPRVWARLGTEAEHRADDASECFAVTLPNDARAVRIRAERYGDMGAPVRFDTPDRWLAFASPFHPTELLLTRAPEAPMLFAADGRPRDVSAMSATDRAAYATALRSYLGRMPADRRRALFEDAMREGRFDEESFRNDSIRQRIDLNQLRWLQQRGNGAGVQVPIGPPGGGRRPP